MHVLLDPLPVYGLAMGFTALLGGSIFIRRGRRGSGLALIFLAGVSAGPVYHYCKAAYDRVKSMVDTAGDQWLDEHMYRGEKLIYLFYVVAALSALGIIVEFRLPRDAPALAIAIVTLAGASLAIGGYFGYARGHVRHKEFQFETAPPPRAEEHHHGNED